MQKHVVEITAFYHTMMKELLLNRSKCEHRYDSSMFQYVCDINAALVMIVKMH